jgi:hypothetical protein
VNPPTAITNTGLGDFYIVSGGLVWLARKHGALRYPALPQYIRAIRQCLADYPEIEVFEVLDDTHMLKQFRGSRDVIRAHWTDMGLAEQQTHIGISSDEWQYEMLGVPFEERWASCPLEAAARHQSQIVFPGPYYLLHEDPERGFPISYPPWHPAILTRRLAPYGKYTQLSWVDAIKRARELHFIDSSPWHLANSISLRKDQPRYLHRYVRNFHRTWHAVRLAHHWQYLDGTPTPFIEPPPSSEDLTRVKNNTAAALQSN